MTSRQFITEKSIELIALTDYFLTHDSGYDALIETTWDILGSWQQVQVNQDIPMSDKEEVFWHLIFELQYWPKQHIIDSSAIKATLRQCIRFLTDLEAKPPKCIGIRPEHELENSSNKQTLDAECI